MASKSPCPAYAPGDTLLPLKVCPTLVHFTMPTHFLSPRFILMRTIRSLGLCLLPLILALPLPLSSQTAAGDAVVVTVEEGVRRVRVLALNPANQEWEMVALAHLDGRAGQVKIRLPAGLDGQSLKVETHPEGPFPARLFSSSTDPAPRPWSGLLGVTGRVSITAAGSVDGAWASAETQGEPTQAVVESDIWRIDGQTVYFFNHYRGLQVFDLADPAQPRKVDELRLPASGEQLYVLDSGHVLLLASDLWGGEGVVLVVRRDAEGLKVVRELPVPGWIRESRLVGQTLYVVSQVYRYEAVPTPPGDTGDTSRTENEQFTYTYQSVVTAWDLSHPEVESPAQEVVLRGWINAAQATPEVLMISLQDWTAPGWGEYMRNQVAVIELGQKPEAMRLAASFAVAGDVSNKFRLHYRNGVCFVVSMVWRWQSGSNESYTLLESFRIRPTGGADKLGELPMGQGESLFATRFDGDRVYVVTFLVIDPLHIVDLSDPANMRQTGELEIPGYSTYLAPVGDRLVAVGVEDRHVTVVLFDVADPERPDELARVRLGDEQSYTWSEANYDEKAVSLALPEKLILVPFQSWTRNGYVKRMQLIDLDLPQGTLRVRGALDHRNQARRAAPLGGQNLVSISGTELFTVDARDRDAPKVMAALDIGWSADQILDADGYVLAFENPFRWWWGWGGGIMLDAAMGWGSMEASVPVLRVLPADDLDHVLSTVPLGPGQVNGAVYADGYLHLVRSGVEAATIEVDGAERIAAPADSQAGLRFETWDMRDPLNPVRSGVLELVPSSEYRGWSTLAAHWLDEGTLLWVSNSGYGGGWYREPTLFWSYGWGWPGVVEFFAVRVEDGGHPSLLSHRMLVREDRYFSGAFLVEDQLLVTLYRMRWDDNRAFGERQDWLAGFDLSDPSNPRALPESPVPGPAMQAFPTGQGGIGIYSLEDVMSHDPDPQSGQAYTWHRVLHALIYDGFRTYPVANAPLPSFSASAFNGPDLYFAESFPNAEGATWWHWRWDGANAFNRTALGRWPEAPAQARWAENLLFATGRRTLWAIDPSAPEPSSGLPFFSVFGANLETALLNPTSALFPMGQYGISEVTWEGLSPRAASGSRPASHSGRRSLSTRTASADWSPLAPTHVTPASLQDATVVGRVVLLNWLFRPWDYERMDPAAQDLGDGWYGSSWFGDYYDGAWPWVAHSEQGWLYPWLRNAGDGVYTWLPSFGWLWTAPAAYPYLYRFEPGSWLYYLMGSNQTGYPLYFDFDPTVEGWILRW